MKNRFDELTKNTINDVRRRSALERLGLGLAAAALACFGLVTETHAQTSAVCDSAGDAIYGSGKGGPTVPRWLDIIQSTMTDSGDNIIFTLTLNAPIPVAPAWNGVDDGGQIWWGWRLVNDGANVTLISNGCVVGKGNKIPAGYFLDLMWNVQTSTFNARLLDDALCLSSTVPFVISVDRTQVTLTVAKALFADPVLLPNPDNFDYFATTLVWKSSSTGNSGFYVIDSAPDSGWATWSSSSSTSYGCP